MARFQFKYPRARRPIANWVNKITEAQWANMAELHLTFDSADYVKPYVVFNVGGNNYRIIALVAFDAKRVQVESVLTHEQYNNWEA